MFQFFGELLKVAGLTFPYDENLPAGFAQLSDIAFASFNISTAFVLPEFFVCCGFDFSISAMVHVPKTAVNKDDFFVPYHH